MKRPATIQLKPPHVMKTSKHIRLSIFAIGCAVLSPLGVFVNRVAANEPPPNIVLIFADEMAPEHIGAYGGRWPTPNLDRLAAEGMQFTRAYAAAPMCTPSRFSVLTGLYPGRCASDSFLEEYPVEAPYSIGWNTRLLGEQETIADRLRSAGYSTGMAGKWHLGSTAGVEPFPEELSLLSDEADRILSDRQAHYAERIRETAGFDQANSVVWGNFDHAPLPEILQYHNIPWITYGATQFIRERSGEEKPFFLYVAPTAVHGPPHQDSLAKDPAVTPGGRIPEVAAFAGYRDELWASIAERPVWEQHQRAGVRQVDELVGHVLDTLEAEGLREKTLIVFMPDHGIEPGKSTVYERGFHVPLLMSWPGRIPAGSRFDGLVQSVDLATTFASVAGAGERASADGVDLSPIWRQGKRRVRDFVYLESGYFRAVSDGYRKLVKLRWPEDVEAKIASGRMEVLTAFGRKQGHALIAANSYPAYFAPDQFYDLVEDPFELDNRIDEARYGAALRWMESELKNMLRSFDHAYPLERTKIFNTKAYRDVAERTRAVDLSSIWWIRRDHGSIDWPPAQL